MNNFVILEAGSAAQLEVQMNVQIIVDNYDLSRYDVVAVVKADQSIKRSYTAVMTLKPSRKGIVSYSGTTTQELQEARDRVANQLHAAKNPGNHIGAE